VAVSISAAIPTLGFVLAMNLCLNGIALASGNWAALIASLLFTSPAYSYRVTVEDEMLVGAFGPAYAEYRRQVRALLPFPRSPRAADER
jgi:protein-S-isoprenylcysteine O-methyltransferase Ste14